MDVRWYIPGIKSLHASLVMKRFAIGQPKRFAIPGAYHSCTHERTYLGCANVLCRVAGLPAQAEGLNLQLNTEDAELG